MGISRHCLVASAAAIALCAGLPQAQAQEASSSPAAASRAAGDPVAIGEVIVTARKRQESLQQVPISITALTTQGLEDRSVTSIADMAKFTPNLTDETFITSGFASAGALGYSEVAYGAPRNWTATLKYRFGD